MHFNQFLAMGPRECSGRADFNRPVALLAVLLSVWIVQAVPAAPEKTGAKAAQSPGGKWEGFRKAALYLPNRAVDFLDIWRFNAGVGLGLGLNIRPTKSLQFGLATYDTVRFGLRGRRWPFWHEWSLEGGFDGMYEELGETERGFYEVGGTIHFLLLGLDAAFDIEEALDFGFGLFLSDPADDDFR